MPYKTELSLLNSMAPGTACVKYTPADTDLAANVKAIVFDADGTITYKNADGIAVTGYPVLKGVALAFVPKRITAMTGPTNCFLIS